MLWRAHARTLATRAARRLNPLPPQRNSWAASWGEQGYIRLARGSAYGPEGQCGVQQDSQWATVSN